MDFSSCSYHLGQFLHVNPVTNNLAYIDHTRPCKLLLLHCSGQQLHTSRCKIILMKLIAYNYMHKHFPVRKSLVYIDCMYKYKWNCLRTSLVKFLSRSTPFMLYINTFCANKVGGWCSGKHAYISLAVALQYLHISALCRHIHSN